MSKFTDQQYLKTEQYKDSSNLDARMEIHRRFSTNPYGWMAWVFDRLLALPADARILELGCGPGYLWKDNAARIPATWDITLSDLSAGMLDSAWRNLVVTGRNYKFKELDAQQIPFEAETFDAVIANHMLYHVPDRRQALQEVRRVLKPEGVFFAATLGVDHMRELWDLLERAGSMVKRETITSAFTLENGAQQLQEFFPRVELTYYPDGLRVTEVAALLAYIRSMTSTADFQEAGFHSVERELTETLARDGAIVIQKSAGLFEAVK